MSFDAFDDENMPDSVRKLLGDSGLADLMRDLGTSEPEDLGEDQDEVGWGHDDGPDAWDEPPAAESCAVQSGEDPCVPQAPEDVGPEDDSGDAVPDDGCPADLFPGPAADLPASVSAVDAGEPEDPGATVAPVSEVPLGKAVGRSRSDEPAKVRLWTLHRRAMMRTARRSSEWEQCIAGGVVAFIEYWLIGYCEESIPEGTEPWDEVKQERELRRRQRRLDYVERRLARRYTGIIGLARLLFGKRPLPMSQLYKREMHSLERETDYFAPFE